ncbi:MAG: nitrophenyl compound nitroreductase subunit ArsF family protein [Bacteroidales bacterium]
MKHVLKIVLAAFVFFIGANLQAQQGKKPGDGAQMKPKVEVYYFHFTARCATCHAVEDNSKNALETLYPEQIKKGEFVFRALNLNEASTKSIADRLGVSGQTLLVVSGDKKIDLTRQGFLYAYEPDKIKQEIQKAVNSVLTR